MYGDRTNFLEYTLGNITADKELLKSEVRKYSSKIDHNRGWESSRGGMESGQVEVEPSS